MSDQVPALTVPAAGWYPDRADPRIKRWWDGQEWTDHVQEAAPAATAFAEVQQPVSMQAFDSVLPAVPAAPAVPAVSAVPAVPAVPVAPVAAAAFPDPAVSAAAMPSAAPAFATPTRIPTAYPAPQASAVPPGWYPDNSDRSLQRWWDGRQWTSHTASSGPPAVNALATRGMIYSLISLVLNPLFIMSIGGLVLGIRGLRRATNFLPENARRGSAIAAVVVGSVSTLLSIIWIGSAIAVYSAQHAAATQPVPPAVQQPLDSGSGAGTGTGTDTGGYTLADLEDSIRLDVQDAAQGRVTVDHVNCPVTAALTTGSTFDCLAVTTGGQTLVAHIQISAPGRYYESIDGLDGTSTGTDTAPTAHA